MKQIRIQARTRREPSWREELPLDPRDPDVIRAKALAHAHAVPVRRGLGKTEHARQGATRDSLAPGDPGGPARGVRARCAALDR